MIYPRSLVALIVCAMVCCVATSSYGDISAAERDALIAFYNSTNGDSWSDNSGWKDPPLTGHEELQHRIHRLKKAEASSQDSELPYPALYESLPYMLPC